MSNNWQKDVADFQIKCGQEVNSQPNLSSEDTINLQTDLIKEEVNRELLAFLDSFAKKGDWDSETFPEDLATIADGIADSIYVLLGLANNFGITIQPIWDAVQKANMLKTTGPVREDGKREKPEGWEHPDVKALIEHQINYPEKYRNLDLTNLEDNRIYIQEIEDTHQAADKSTLKFTK